MSKYVYALLSIALIACGQAGPEPQSTSPLGSQREQLQANPDRAPIRCGNDQLPRPETPLAAPPVLKRDPMYRAPVTAPPRPEVIEAPPAKAGGAEPL